MAELTADRAAAVSRADRRTESMRLVHLTTVDLSLRFLLHDQLLAFRDAGFEVIAASAPGPWIQELRRDGIRFEPVPALGRRFSPFADLVALVQLVRLFRRLRPLIVHGHTPKAGVLGRIAARLAGVPVVVNTVHGFYPSRGPWVVRALALAVERVAARASDFEFCQSAEDLETLRRLRVVEHDRSAYLGNGVDLRRFDPSRVDRGAARSSLRLSADAVVVGTVGRLVWEKGYREVFAMAEALRREDPRVVVLVVGPQEPGKADAVPAEIIMDLEDRGVARFLGMRTDMPDLYAAMDVFVLGSYREGFPRSAIEAAAMGRPLVATDIRGCREVVEEDRNGYLVPVGDVAALTGRVSRLVRDPELRRRLGEESRRRAAAEFDERRVIATTLEVYRQLIWEHAGVRLPYPAREPGR